MTDNSRNIYLIPRVGAIRIIVSDVAVDRPMEPKGMRTLAIALLHAAEETEHNIKSMKSVHT